MPRFVKIELMYGDSCQGGYIDDPENMSITDLIDGLEPGDDSYRISVVEMTKKEKAELPEFVGF